MLIAHATISAMRRVVKFGGTSLATPAQVREGARQVARLVEYGEQIAVVVSAPGNATSELLQAIYDASEQRAQFADTCSFAALGEEQSVHLMAAALRSFGVAAELFLPRDTQRWPIIADIEDNSPIALAKINEERPFRLRTQQTVSRFRRLVLPHLRVGTVPVISGFFAVDSSERIVSLGRGGSDITAMIVAQQLSADEVVVVTDVQGVLSADPRLADNPRLLDSLSTETLEVISSAGARIIHPRALKYKTEHLRIRLIDYRELDRLEEAGTSVLGKSTARLDSSGTKLSMLTLLLEPGSEQLLAPLLHEWLASAETGPTSFSMTPCLACYYFDSAVADRAYSQLHDLLNDRQIPVTNLSLRGELAELRLRSRKFLEEPGVLAEITGVLANARINIVEIQSGHTDITLYIDYQERERAEKLLRQVLDQFTG